MSRIPHDISQLCEEVRNTRQEVEYPAFKAAAEIPQVREWLDKPDVRGLTPRKAMMQAANELFSANMNGHFLAFDTQILVEQMKLMREGLTASFGKKSSRVQAAALPVNDLFGRNLRALERLARRGLNRDSDNRPIGFEIVEARIARARHAAQAPQ